MPQMPLMNGRLSDSAVTVTKANPPSFFGGVLRKTRSTGSIKDAFFVRKSIFEEFFQAELAFITQYRYSILIMPEELFRTVYQK